MNVDVYLYKFLYRKNISQLFNIHVAVWIFISIENSVSQPFYPFGTLELGSFNA